MLSIAKRSPGKHSWFNNERGNRKTFASLALRPLGGGAALGVHRRLRCVLAQQLSAAPAGRPAARSNSSFARAGISQRNRERKNYWRKTRTTSGRVPTRA